MQNNENEVVYLYLDDIIPNRFQPRLTFDEEALNELSNSIKEHGIIQPLILRDLGNKYEIIAGERRYKAAIQAGLELVPAIIGAMDDQTSAELALIENIQRKDLSAIEEAKSYKKILDMGGFTQEELAKRMGKNQSTIANKMRLLSLTNEVQVALMNNLISERHARSLLQVKDEDKQREVLNKIINERMNVRATDEYIKNLEAIKIEEPSIDLPQNNTNELVKPTEEVILPSLGENSEVPAMPSLDNPTIENNNYKEDGNPNIYAQDKHDFVNMDNLNQKTEEMIKNNSESNVEKTSIEEIKEKPVNIEKNMNSDINEEKKNKVKEDKLSKVKLATAIRLAKDTVEDIKTAGYSVTLEEIDEPGIYKLVINVQK